MKYNTKSVLNEIRRNKAGIEKSIKRNINFKKYHKNTLNLCHLIFPNSKKKYRDIDINYPELTQVKITNPNTKQIKNMDSEVMYAIYTQKRKILAEKSISILNRALELYLLKHKIEIKT